MANEGPCEHIMEAILRCKELGVVFFSSDCGHCGEFLVNCAQCGIEAQARELVSHEAGNATTSRWEVRWAV